jgi:hypothetical protein
LTPSSSMIVQNGSEMRVADVATLLAEALPPAP